MPHDTMLTADQPQHRRRKRNERPTYKRGCSREGCSRQVMATSPRERRICSGVCNTVDREMEQAQRVCQAIGNSSLATELWLSVVALNDALTEYQRLDNELLQVAESAGISREQWDAIKRGD